MIRILIVEDDRIVAREIEQQLQRSGYSVVGLTARGEDAVGLVRELEANLVLMNIRLEGELDGIEAAIQIRDQCRVPLTAYADDRTAQRVSQAEPFGYLVKPFEDSQLRTAIEIARYKYAADQKLRDSEHRYAVTLSSIGDAVIATDSAGAITFMNPTAAALTGWPAALAVGQPLIEVFHAIDEVTREPIGDPNGGAERYSILVARDGSERPVDHLSSPIITDDGSVAGVVVVFRDITLRRRAAEAELLRRSNERMELALRGSDIAMFEFELVDGSLENARVHAVNLWDRTRTGAVPVPLSTFAGAKARWHPDDRDRIVAALEGHLTSSSPQLEYIGRSRHASGEFTSRLVRAIAVRDSEGRATHLIGSSIDVSDRIAMEGALRASEERYRNTFENAPVGFVHTDFVNYAILRANQTYCDMVGRTHDEVLGRAGMDIIHPDDREGTLARFEKLKSGELSSYVTQFRVFRKDGALLWVRLSISIGRDHVDGPPYAIGIVEDISERYRLETELHDAKVAAETSNRAKDEFLANVSHEIRTPMNAILGMTELVLDTSLTDPQRQSLRTVKSAASGLLAIINDLLDFSKIEAGRLELDPLDFQLRALLGDTMRALAMRAHRKGLELLCNVAPDVPDALVGDAGRLRQILTNLVGNAIKFTARGEVQVDVTVRAATGPDVDIQFAVRDTGIGIPRDKQASIFLAFEQEDMSTTRRYGGTGLGLTIASRLVAMMGGTITVDSVPAHGSTFTFDAHFVRRDHVVSSAPEPRGVLGNVRALIVDDNQANREILLQWLRGWRMEPEAVSDGLAALDALWHGVASGQPYALVLLDARMPDTDGLALAAKIRERAEIAGTRIILLTSGDRPGDLERIRELRIDAHVLKPVPQDELLDTIHDVMSRRDVEVRPRSVTSIQTAAEASDESPVPLRVLVAEDNRFNSQLLRQLLASRGHAVRIAGNGREALELATRGGFELLLLDLHMPELDGFAVITALRAYEAVRGGHLATIALTARSRAEDRQRCFDAGMDDFLAKPIDAGALWAAIERVTGARSSQDLISADVLLAACGHSPEILEEIRAGLHLHVPQYLAAIDAALAASDANRLRELAHSIAGMLAAVSRPVSAIASQLEDESAAGDVAPDRSRPLVAQLRVLANALLLSIDAVTIASLEAVRR